MDHELPCGSQIASFLIFPEKIDDILDLGAKGRASQKALPGGQLTSVTRCADSDWRRGVWPLLLSLSLALSPHGSKSFGGDVVCPIGGVFQASLRT